MKFYSQDVVERVRNERKKGISIRKLEKIFKIPNVTISRWVRDIQSTANAFNSARKREHILQTQLTFLADNLTINNELAKVLVSIMYWCEGSKYPSSNFLSFCNSDYFMMKTYLTLLRRAFRLNERKLKVHLQLHTTHSFKDSVNFWSRLLDIPVSQFYKPTVTKPTNRMKRLNYKGTCTIKYFDVKLLLQITGLYKRFAKKHGGLAEWLKAEVC